MSQDNYLIPLLFLSSLLSPSLFYAFPNHKTARFLPTSSHLFSLCLSHPPSLSLSPSPPALSPLSPALSEGCIYINCNFVVVVIYFGWWWFYTFFYEEQGNVGLGSIYIADNFVVNLYLTKYGEYIS